MKQYSGGFVYRWDTKSTPFRCGHLRCIDCLANRQSAWNPGLQADRGTNLATLAGPRYSPVNRYFEPFESDSGSQIDTPRVVLAKDFA